MALSCPAQINWARMHQKKKSTRWLVRPGGNTARQERGPEARITPLGHRRIKEWLFQTGSCGEEGSRAVADRLAALVSQGTNGGEWRSRKSRRWLIHGLARRLCVDMCVCVYGCVCALQDTQWMTDWQGHGWARLHQHRRLLWCVHSPFTHPDQSCLCTCVVSYPVIGVLFQNQNHNHFICQVQ